MPKNVTPFDLNASPIKTKQKAPVLPYITTTNDAGFYRSKSPIFNKESTMFGKANKPSTPLKDIISNTFGRVTQQAYTSRASEHFETVSQRQHNTCS